MKIWRTGFVVAATAALVGAGAATRVNFTLTRC
jgi:hypothetical protein